MFDFSVDSKKVDDEKKCYLMKKMKKLIKKLKSKLSAVFFLEKFIFF